MSQNYIRLAFRTKKQEIVRNYFRIFILTIIQILGNAFLTTEEKLGKS